MIILHFWPFFKPPDPDTEDPGIWIRIRNTDLTNLIKLSWRLQWSMDSLFIFKNEHFNSKYQSFWIHFFEVNNRTCSWCTVLYLLDTCLSRPCFVLSCLPVCVLSAVCIRVVSICHPGIFVLSVLFCHECHPYRLCSVLSSTSFCFLQVIFIRYFFISFT